MQPAPRGHAAPKPACRIAQRDHRKRGSCRAVKGRRCIHPRVWSPSRPWWPKPDRTSGGFQAPPPNPYPSRPRASAAALLDAGDGAKSAVGKAASWCRWGLCRGHSGREARQRNREAQPQDLHAGGRDLGGKRIRVRPGRLDRATRPTRLQARSSPRFVRGGLHAVMPGHAMGRRHLGGFW